MDNNKMTQYIRELKKILAQGEQTKRNAAQQHSELQGDQDHTQDWKNRRAMEIRDREEADYRRLGELARPALDYLKGYQAYAASRFDYLEPAFQSALNTVTALGKNLPYEAQAQIAGQFRGNLVALDALQELYQAHGLNTGLIGKLKAPFARSEQAVEETFREFIGRATLEKDEPAAQAMGIEAHASWNPQGVREILRDIEEGFGLDTSVHPYVTQMKELLASSDDPDKRGRISRYLEAYENKLNQDDPDAVELVGKKLKQRFA